MSNTVTYTGAASNPSPIAGTPFSGYITWDVAAGAWTGTGPYGQDGIGWASMHRTGSGCRLWTDGVCTQGTPDALPKPADVIDYRFSWIGGDLNPLDWNPADEANLDAISLDLTHDIRELWSASRNQEEWTRNVDSSAHRHRNLSVLFQSPAHRLIFDKPDVSIRPNLTLESKTRLNISSYASSTQACSAPAPSNQPCVVEWNDSGSFNLSGHLTSMTVVDGRPVELAETGSDFMSLLVLFWAWPWGR